MSDEIEIISDGDGLALFGDGAAIEAFLRAEGLASTALDIQRVVSSGATARAGAALEAGSLIAANAGRWVQLSDKSAALMKNAELMKGSAEGLSRAVVLKKPGEIGHIVEFVRAPATWLTNPAVLAGVGGLMAQMAMQKAIEDIHDYLEVIDKKVDDILRAQKHAVLADAIAVGLVIEEAMVLREQTGRVSEVTWSKVQGASFVIARTQAYALQQLDAIAQKLEGDVHVDEVAKMSTAAGQDVQEWLVVLARCFQLHDAVGVLELDRVLDAEPDELERHRAGLRLARERRREAIAASTARLLERMAAIAELKNAEIVFNPLNARKVVQYADRSSSEIVRFRGLLGLEQEHRALEPKRWGAAVGELRDDVVDQGVAQARVVKGVGVEVVGRVRERAQSITGDVIKRLPGRSGSGE